MENADVYFWTIYLFYWTFIDLFHFYLFLYFRYKKIQVYFCSDLFIFIYVPEVDFLKKLYEWLQKNHL